MDAAVVNKSRLTSAPVGVRVTLSSKAPVALIGWGTGVAPEYPSLRGLRFPSD